MVSPKRSLGMSFDKLRRSNISPLNYQGALRDVVFDMVTADSFVAGIADRVIDGQQIPGEHHSGMSQELFSENAWVSQVGRRFDLIPLPELWEYAWTIEETRKACLHTSTQ